MADNDKTEKQTILHMAYRYKDEATGQYVTAYFENDLRDVQIPNELQDRFFGAVNMLDFVTSLMVNLQTFNLKTVRKLSTEIVPTEVYADGQIVYETNTRKYKIGDGVTQYQFLPYGKAEEDPQILTNNISDVKINETQKDSYFEQNDLEGFMSSLMAKLGTLGPLAVRTTSTAVNQNKIYADGQLVYETDTRKSKLGDGVTPYKNLLYLKAEEDEQILTNTISDVNIPNAVQDEFLGAKNVKEFFTALMEKLQTYSPKTIRLYSYQFPPTKVYEAGQVIYEIDTKKLKIGDGHTQYQFLPYTASSGSDEPISVDPVISDTETIEYPSSTNVEVIVEDSAVTAEISDTGVVELLDIDNLEVLNTAPTDGRTWYAEQIA